MVIISYLLVLLRLGMRMTGIKILFSRFRRRQILNLLRLWTYRHLLRRTEMWHFCRINTMWSMCRWSIFRTWAMKEPLGSVIHHRSSKSYLILAQLGPGSSRRHVEWMVRNALLKTRSFYIQNPKILGWIREVDKCFSTAGVRLLAIPQRIRVAFLKKIRAVWRSLTFWPLSEEKISKA